MTDWQALTARAGAAGHDLVGWLMWDPPTIAAFESLGVPNGAGWLVSWRLAPMGDVEPAVAAAATFSVHPDVVAMVLGMWRGVTDAESILAVRDAAIEPGLESIAPGLFAELGELADDLWRGVDSVHFGARPLFAAHRACPRRNDSSPGLSAWLAANCLRELRGDNHWALCASEDLDEVEVGLLHSVMVDPEEYGSAESIARSRGNDDEAIAAGWARLEIKGLAADRMITDIGREFRLELERRTDRLTAPAWQVVGEGPTQRFCELIEPHHDALLARIDETAGPRWMPAARAKRP